MANGRRKAGVAVLVSALVLVGLLVAADRGAAWAAENAIADRVSQKAQQANIETAGEPNVTVEGFPFLTQAFAGEYQAIRIQMEQLTVEGVKISSLDVRAAEVRASLSDVTSGGDVVAGTVTGDATVPFSAVEELVGVEDATVSGDEGKLLIRAPFDYGAGRVTVVARAKVSAARGGVKVDVQEVGLSEGQAPPYAQAALDAFGEKLSRTFPLPSLPYGLKVEGAEVRDTGVVATASATDVPLS